ncbi:transposase domain-containing protein, partial [Klebsiella pneumoniae]
NTYDLFVGKTLLHGDVLMWLMKTLLTSRCINQRGAGQYSLIGTCKLNGVEPESYLRYVLDVIADWPINRVSELLPWRVALPTE